MSAVNTTEGLAGMEAIELRIAALERSARRWRAAAGAVALLAVVVAGMGAAGDGGEIPKAIKAQSFQVVNASGDLCGVFLAGPGDNALLRCDVVRSQSFDAMGGDKVIASLGADDEAKTRGCLALFGTESSSFISAGSNAIEVEK